MVNGTEAFLEMLSKWERIIGGRLASEDPRIILRIVELTSTEEGISQHALQEGLNLFPAVQNVARLVGGRLRASLR